MIYVLDILLLLILPITALAVVKTKDLLTAAIIYSIYSFDMAIIYTQLNAPDVALTEAAVGAGVTTILFMIAISKTERMEE